MRRSRRSSTDSPSLPEEDRRLLEAFLEKLGAIPEIQAVVLFGSFARGDVDRRSDIDLLLVTDVEDPGALRARLARLISELKPHREISPTLTNLHDLDPSFLRNVFQDGIVLRGKLVLDPRGLALQPRVLIAYDLSGIGPSQKVHISRLVHGFRSSKTVAGKRHTYRYAGLKDRYGATVVSRSVFFLKPEQASAFAAELDALHVPFQRWDLYL